MTEMKEKDINPKLPVIRENPSAPDIELKEMRNNATDGHTYRLKVISDVQKFFRNRN